LFVSVKHVGVDIPDGNSEEENRQRK